jgi:hypothetical protein
MKICTAPAPRADGPAPVSLIADLYAERGWDFGDVLGLHLLYGYVFNGPDYFVMGHAVGGDDTDLWLDLMHPFPRAEQTGWAVSACAGNWQRALLDTLPYELPFLFFQRFGRDMRWHRVKVESLKSRYAKSKCSGLGEVACCFSKS